MKNFILALLIFLIWAFLGMSWYYSCSFCKTTKENIIIEIPVSIVNSPLYNIADESGQPIFSFQEQLYINKNSTSVHIPESLSGMKDSIFNYLNNNQDKELQILGWYNNEETKTDNDSLNFGIYRANYLKRILVNFGLNADKINTSSKKHDYKYTSDQYKGGIELSFNKITQNKTKTINKGIISKTLNTKFNSREFIIENTLQTYTADLKNYLRNHPDEIVKITGHTDSFGDELNNKIIGLDRATNVMQHFITQGIDPSKIQVFSKGELVPIVTNATKEGRAKNRRIEITIN